MRHLFRFVQILARSYIAVHLTSAIAIFPVCAQEKIATLQTAQKLFHQRDLPGARREFLSLQKTKPEFLLARYYLGRIALLESHPAEAIQWFEPVAVAEPPVLDTVEQLAKAYLDAGQIEKAKAATERAIRISPWNGALHYRLGRIYQQLGNTTDSRREFSKSANLKSADRESVQSLLICSELLAKRERVQALETGRPFLQSSSIDPDVLVAFGLTFARAGLQAEAEEYFHRAAERDPGFLQAQFNTGLALLKLGRTGEAVGFLEKARQLGPDNVEATAALALAYFSQSRYAEALPVLESWRRLASLDPRIANMHGMALLRTGAPGKAVAVLRQAVRDSRNDPKPSLLLVEALNAAERPEEALQVSAEALRSFPDIAQVALANAQQLARLGRYSDAVRVFGRAAELAPGESDPLLGLAEAQQKQGEYQASLATYQRVLALDKANVTACLGAARNLVFLKRLPEARELLEAAVNGNAGDSRLHYELSTVYAKLGERQLAAEQGEIFKKLRENPVKAP